MSAGNSHWGGSPPNPPTDENGPQLKAMGLKVHYTFDKDSQERCLARWPQTLHLRTIPLDDRNAIGVVDLRTCLQAIADCSPELTSESDKDYTVYAYDYSEPDTPLVGQGMLSTGLNPQSNSSGQVKLVTGRVTQNLLAIFGNGVQETLEVRLKLTAVSKAPQLFPTLPVSTSNMSENNEWNSLIQSNPNFGRSANVSTVSSPALGPVRYFNSSYETTMGMNNASQSGSRPASVDLATNGRCLSAAPRPASRQAPVAIAPQPSEDPSNTATNTKTTESQPQSQSQSQSRPGSRASTKRGPTGRPRGRPSKKALAAESSAAGCEEATEADDGSAPKKRAKVTQVGRSNSALFGSEPDSLRVAASNAQSIRSFRPVSVGGDGPSGNHLQDVPRAPTPVPDSQPPSFPQARPRAPSGLWRESTSLQGPGCSPNPPKSMAEMKAFVDMNRSMSQGVDARSPVDSITPSPCNLYSDEATPFDMRSSPPVPRSALFSAQSSPAPSSPALPPMRMPQSVPDSGFMSGSFDDSRAEYDDMGKTPKEDKPQPPIVEKPKPKPRKSRAKKDGASKKEPVKPPQKQKGLVIQEITPGPPELLPKTSLYNPPQSFHKRPLTPSLSISSDMVSLHQPQFQGMEVHGMVGEAGNPMQSIEQPINSAQQFAASFDNQESSIGQPPTGTPVEAETRTGVFEPTAQTTQREEDAAQNVLPQGSRAVSPAEVQQDFAEIENALDSYRGEQNQQYPESFELSNASFSQPPGDGDAQMPKGDILSLASASNEPGTQEVSAEPELPQIPESDPGLPQLALPFPMSEAPHPETDAMDPPAVKANKNYIKREAIKQKLEEAIAHGQLPTFCRNCAALQTPTWRKIWKQIHQGVPEYHEYSEKPGCVTAINILEKDKQGKPTKYEMVKKALGPNEDKSAWIEWLLCNPCGIWFSKWKTHRPPEKWEKDEKRLGQVRKKRAAGGGASRAKKSRTKNNSQTNLTSEAGIATDPVGPGEGSMSPGMVLPDPFVDRQPDATSEAGSGKDRQRTRVNDKGPGSTHSRASNHSRGSGTPGSPITINEDLGPARRLLFPSPSKDGEQRVLGEVGRNVVQPSPAFGTAKKAEDLAQKKTTGQENGGAVAEGYSMAKDEFADLFGTPPPARPSTPPAQSSANSGPFKTPTRPTPSHRPITRSVSKSMRSTASVQSPSQLLMLEGTPTKTPRSLAPTSNAMLRRSPRNAADGVSFQHLADNQLPYSDPSFTKALNELLAEANGIVTPGRHHGTAQVDNGFHFEPSDHSFDFGSMLSGNDYIMPSSPSQMMSHEATAGGPSSQAASFESNVTFNEEDDHLWARLSGAQMAGPMMGDNGGHQQ